MTIRSTKFVKGIVKEEDLLTDDLPQLLFIGRSNVGKSSVINSFVNKKNMAVSSATAGRTTQVNVFLINHDFYLIDLPGYGYAKGADTNRQDIVDLISWYVFRDHTEERRIVLIVDAETGLMDSDLRMIRLLNAEKEDYIVLANKADKITGNKLSESLKDIREAVGDHTVITYSARKNTGKNELTHAALKGLKKITPPEKFEEFELNRYVFEDEIEEKN